VVGDLAGFVAATYMRGVPVVQVPTTLLAMVDASVGGKTGVDTPAGKNLVGAFHHPAAVVADPRVLATLPARELRAGMAEMIKHGAISDRAHFDAVARWAAETHRSTEQGGGLHRDPGEAVALIGRSVAVKAEIVRDDPREGGRRQVLNAGHTIAHALELVSGYTLLHGEAVAIGLVTEAMLGEHLQVTRTGTAAALAAALGGAGLPTSLPPGTDAALLVDAMRTDKKGRAGAVAFAFLAEPGRVAPGADGQWVTRLSRDALVNELRAATAITSVRAGSARLGS
jgi:3-dehydroquinate synthase